MSGIAIFGITGRMGQCLIRALRETAGDAAGASGGPAVLHLVGASASAGSRRLDQDAAADGPPTGVRITADPRAALAAAAVAIDFSLPQAVAANAQACREMRIPLLVGTTGFGDDTRMALQSAAADIPLLVAANTSVGVNVAARLVKLATQALGTRYDVEISEAHHRMKRDAPSGTALALGEVVAQARGTTLLAVAVFDRHGAAEPRPPGAIGFSVMRAGDIVGEHSVIFAIAGERIEITHRATDRITFARGALRAAAWLIGRPNGSYTMNDVIGLAQP
jgi:4-hydroxy-tetrahydrodipicolinate reductase